MVSKLEKISEGLTAIFLEPVILPLAYTLKQPIIQNTIKDGICLSDRVKYTVTEFAESWDNIWNGNKKSESESLLLTDINQKSELAEDVINIISDFNTDVKQITKGIADLRVILPLAIALLAIRQFMKKGLQLEEIPWYILLWYAFDMFTRLNVENESQVNNLSINAVSIELQERKDNNSNNS
jgi:hypothetical protein